MIIDGEDLILGRLGAFAAKKALLGEKIDIINCEKIIISGNKKNILAKYKQRTVDLGNINQGPYYPRRADMFVKRLLRGMFPHKQEKGRKAYERIRCHIGTDNRFKDKKTEQLKRSGITKLPTLRYITIKELCDQLGGGNR